MFFCWFWSFLVLFGVFFLAGGERRGQEAIPHIPPQTLCDKGSHFQKGSLFQVLHERKKTINRPSQVPETRPSGPHFHSTPPKNLNYCCCSPAPPVHASALSNGQWAVPWRLVARKWSSLPSSPGSTVAIDSKALQLSHPPAKSPWPWLSAMPPWPLASGTPAAAPRGARGEFLRRPSRWFLPLSASAWSSPAREALALLPRGSGSDCWRAWRSRESNGSKGSKESKEDLEEWKLFVEEPHTQFSLTGTLQRCHPCQDVFLGPFSCRLLAHLLRYSPVVDVTLGRARTYLRPSHILQQCQKWSKHTWGQDPTRFKPR